MPVIKNKHEGTTIVQCDTMGCGNTTDFDYDDEISFIRQEAMKRGWVYFSLNKNTKFICPTCITKSKEEKKINK